MSQGSERMTDEETEENWHETARAIELPEWLTKCLPEPKPILTIKWADEKFIVVDSSGVIVDSGDSIIELYDRHDKKEIDWFGDPSVNGHGGRLIGGSFFAESDNGDYSSRLLIFIDDDTRLCLLKSSYGAWLKTYAHWCENREDPFSAFEMIQGHPILWKRYKAEPTLDWDTSSGYDKLYLYVMAEDDGKWFVAELGGHVPSDYTHYYHDYRLDVSAKSLDGLYVNIAQVIDQYFDSAGNERIVPPEDYPGLK